MDRQRCLLVLVVAGLGLLGSCGVSLEDVRRIAPEEVKEALVKEDVVIVDVRSASSFKTIHIQGARHLPLAEIQARFSELPKDSLIVTYCS